MRISSQLTVYNYTELKRTIEIDDTQSETQLSKVLAKDNVLLQAHISHCWLNQSHEVVSLLSAELNAKFYHLAGLPTNT